MQVSGARRTGKKKGTIGLAKSYQLSEITPAFLAYVAVVVCLDFALLFVILILNSSSGPLCTIIRNFF